MRQRIRFDSHLTDAQLETRYLRVRTHSAGVAVELQRRHTTAYDALRLQMWTRRLSMSLSLTRPGRRELCGYIANV
jgi:hypothetical protein